jgi:hypothetical protein
MTRTEEELSIVCEDQWIPAEAQAERNWRAFQVQGPLDFGLTGVLASIANPLSEAKISIFSISTFDTDYILVKSSDLAKATHTLLQSGFTIK